MGLHQMHYVLQSFQPQHGVVLVAEGFEEGREGPHVPVGGHPWVCHVQGIFILAAGVAVVGVRETGGGVRGADPGQGLAAVIRVILCNLFPYCAAALPLPLLLLLL